MKINLPIIVLLILVLGIFVYSINPVFANELVKNPVKTPVNLHLKFDTDLFSGTASYSYPIKVPKGTSDLTPELNVTYNSAGSRDIEKSVGNGWKLSKDYIERDTNGTPSFMGGVADGGKGDDKFRLHLNGVIYDLVYVSSDDTYHTKSESFLKIKKYTNNTNNDKGEYWMVTTKDGTKYRFGYFGLSELLCEGKNHTFDVNRDFVLRWNLDLVEDTHENKIYYTYLESNGTTYLDKIEYNTPKERLIDFNYTSNTYQHPVYYLGCKMKDDQRLSNIQVKVGSTLVRQYDFAFSSDTTKQPLLTSITEKGNDGTSTLPATTFEYKPQNRTWSTTRTTWLNNSSNSEIDSHLENFNLTLADVNGDGMVDIVKSFYHIPNVTWKVIPNLGTSFATSWETWVNNSGGLDEARLDGNDTRLVDVTGDNLPDIVKTNGVNNGNATWRVNKNTGNSWNTTAEVWIDNKPVNVHLNEASVVIQDVNGDNLADIVKSYKDGNQKDVWVVYRNTGSSWNQYNEGWLSEVQYNVQLGEDHTRLVDINGDNLPDIVKTSYSGTNVTWDVWKNTGDSWDKNGEKWIDNQNLDAHLEQENTVLVDANGDGLPDVIKIIDNNSSDEWKVLLNKGNSWATSWEIWVPTSANVNADAAVEKNLRVVDVDGDGLSDILKTEVDGGHLLWMVWKNNGKSPDLLASVTTPQGGKISFDYIASTKFDNTGADTIPDLPFNMWLVDKMTVTNGLTNSQATTDITNYSYQDGWYKWQDKEFRGFSTVDETLQSGAKNKYVFKQDDIYKGLLEEQQTRDGSNNPYTETENTWANSQANGINTISLTQQKKYTYDGSSSNPKIVQTDYTYDNYGNVEKQSELGDINVTGDERFTNFEYVYNTTAWIVDKVKRTYKEAADDTTKVSESRFYYDGNTSIDTSPTKGDLTKEEKWIGNTTYTATNYAYDFFGNISSTTDPRSYTTAITYDSANTYPVTTTNPLSHITTTSYDLGTGNLLSITDPNGLVTTNTYDVFGRITKEIKPYDNSNQPTVSYTYYNDGTAPEGTLISKREVSSGSATLDTYTWIDGLNRTVQTRADAEDTTKQIIKDTYYYDSGEVKKETVPYLATMSTSYTTPSSGIRNIEYTYDLLSRVTSIKNPKEGISYKAYDHWKVTETDEKAKIKIQYFNAYDKITNVEEKNGTSTYTTNYTYNERDDLTQITDNAANNFNFTYDALSRKITQDDPDMGEWTFEYDGAGNMTKKTDARGIETLYEYDQLNRKTKENFPTDTDVAYTYDGNNKKGTLTSVTNAGGIVTYSYDDRLRKTQEQRGIEGITMTTSYAYDALDRVTSKTNPDNTTINYAFNNQGEIETVADGSTNIVSDIDYNALGKITSKDFANSVSTTYTYNADDFRLNRIQTVGSTNLFDSSYTYDAVGNIASIVDNIDTKTQTYGYDDLHRLTVASESAGFNYAYQYNSIGNLTNFTSDEENIEYAYGQSAGPHALTSSTEAAGTSTPPVSSNRYSIYDDGLTSGWYDWSWSSTNNLSNTTYPYIGTKSISWKVDSGYGGLKLHKDNGIDTTGYEYLTVAIRASESGQLAPRIKVNDSQGNTINNGALLADYGGDPVTNKYKIYSIPLSALGASNMVIGDILIQDISGTAQPILYVDSVALTGVSATAAFTAEFFNNKTLSGTPNLTRQDSTVNFDWVTASYDESGPVDNFSARWTKTETFIAGDYEFKITVDDGARVYLDNELIIDEWQDQSATTYTINKAVTGGTHDIRVEYYDSGNDAVAQFSYKKLSGSAFTIYDEGLRPEWEDWSWSGTVNFSATANPNTGSKNINWQPSGQYAGLYFHHSGNGFATNNYTDLTFAIQATQSNQSVEVIMIDNNNNTIGSPLLLSNYGGNPVTGSYTVYSIPLTDLGANNTTIKGFHLKDVTGNSTNQLFVDSVRFSSSD